MDKLKTILFFIIGVICLSGAALYNTYPLVTSDTGTYINSAFTFEVARDRPFAYSFLIFLTSFKYSLWFVVLVQGTLIYFLINRINEQLFGDEFIQKAGSIISIAALAWLSSVTWYTGQIMPDVFTAIGALAAFLFLTEKGKIKWFYAFLIVFSIATHTSHLLIFVLLSLVLAAIEYFQNSRVQKATKGFLWICAASWILVPLFHLAVDGRFTTNDSFHVFMTGRLIETGTLQRYLGKTCKEASDNPLCPYKDQLPNRAIDFIWDQNSPMYKTDGWADADGHYKKMVRRILFNPKYLFQFLSSSFFSSLSQLVQTDVGDGLVPNIENSNPYWKVQQYYPYELPAYLTNRQNTNHLYFSQSNIRYRWVAFVSMILLLYALFFSKRANQITKEERLLVFICIGTIILNGFITATFGNVLARLQSRVMWLLPFVTGVIYLKWYLTSTYYRLSRSY